MSSKTFPDVYRGGNRAFGSIHGCERWELEKAVFKANCEKGMQQWLDSNVPETANRRMGRAGCHLHLGLIYAWEGRVDEAKAHMADCAAITLRHIEQSWPNLDAYNNCEPTLNAAMAAALVNQEELAQRLFTYAARFAAGLVTGDGETPPRSYINAAPFFISEMFVQSYSQLRLGQTSGFRAMIYRAGFPEAKNVDPIWSFAGLHDLFSTIDTAIAVARAKRDSMNMWNSKKYLMPVMRTLLAYMQSAADGKARQERDTAREVAQTALEKYFSMIRDMSDFPPIYLRVLDLQKAYPQIYAPVTPSVFS